MKVVKNLAILGATGSIGQSTLAVVAEYPQEFRVAALADGTGGPFAKIAPGRK